MKIQSGPYDDPCFLICACGWNLCLGIEMPLTEVIDHAETHAQCCKVQGEKRAAAQAMLENTEGEKP